MRLKSVLFGTLIAVVVALPGVAEAKCVKKAAEATSGSKESAQWFVMETIVQQISWGLWPGWVATGELPGYSIRNKRFKCKKGDWGVTCYGQATVCKK